MGYYPIFLDVTAKPVLLVGGGHVADEKIHKLVDAGARVTVVAPELIASVRAYIDDGRADWLERTFEDGDTAGHSLVMIATDEGVVNRRVAEEARSHGILVNAADDKDNCDFILGGLVQRGGIQITASTGGTSPAMARWLRERLEEFLTDDVVALGAVLAAVRREVRGRDRECAASCGLVRTPPPLLCGECPNRVPGDRWQEAVDDELLALLAAGRTDEAHQRLIAALGATGELLPGPSPVGAGR